MCRFLCELVFPLEGAFLVMLGGHRHQAFRMAEVPEAICFQVSPHMGQLVRALPGTPDLLLQKDVDPILKY